MFKHHNYSVHLHDPIKPGGTLGCVCYTLAADEQKQLYRLHFQMIKLLIFTPKFFPPYTYLHQVTQVQMYMNSHACLVVPYQSNYNVHASLTTTCACTVMRCLSPVHVPCSNKSPLSLGFSIHNWRCANTSADHLQPPGVETGHFPEHT